MPLPPTVDEDWRQREFVPGISAKRVFLVNGVADEAAAIVAVGIQFGTPFSLDGSLISTTPQAGSFKGPQCLEVTVSYQASGTSSERSPNPLAQPPKFKWSKGTMSMASDIDRRGNAILSTSNMPLEGGSDDVGFKILRVTRNQFSFDVAQSIAYEDSYNDAPVTIPMAGTVEAGQMKCVSIEPMEEYDIKHRYVPVAYEFWIWKGRVRDADGVWDAWKHRILNASRVGWYNDGGTKKPGNFVNSNGAQPSEPVLLDEDGKPLNAGFKVERAAGYWVEPVAAPNTFSSTLIEKTPFATFMKYYKCTPRPFGALSLF